MSLLSAAPLPDDIPTIDSIEPGIERPKWSVMIPTYNCASYLRETLASILAQDPGPQRMQIEVVDDCSTKDDPEAVVRELGGGRVVFFRQPQNVGITRNFNTCVRRSRGELVHLLHGDDLVLPAFYRSMEELADRHPQRGFLRCRVLFIDQDGHVTGVDSRTVALEEGGCDPAPYFYGNPFQTAGVVLRRSVYEEVGGFNQTWRHAADWEMWLRAIANCGGVAMSQPLAQYRVFPGNDTSQLKQSGDNIREAWQCGVSFARRYPGYSLEQCRRTVVRTAVLQMRSFMQADNWNACHANMAVIRDLQTTKERILFPFREALRKLARWLRSW